MGRKQAAAGTADPTAPASGKKSHLVPALVVALGLVAGGYLMGGKGGTTVSAAPAPPGDDAGEHTEPAPEPGEVVALEPITLNLADGRYLKVGLALQLPLAEDGGHGAAAPEADAVAGFAARALDEAIAVLGSKRYDELVGPGGRDHAKQELSERVAERYEGEVMGVYFTEFVMQ